MAKTVKKMRLNHVLADEAGFVFSFIFSARAFDALHVFDDVQSFLFLLTFRPVAFCINQLLDNR